MIQRTKFYPVCLLASILWFSLGCVFDSKPDFDEENQDLVTKQLLVFFEAIDHFRKDVNRLPHSLEELVKSNEENWRGPYLKGGEVPTDPWGNEYHVIVERGYFEISSLGPDGIFDTIDDNLIGVGYGKDQPDESDSK